MSETTSLLGGKVRLNTYFKGLREFNSVFLQFSFTYCRLKAFTVSLNFVYVGILKGFNYFANFNH